MVVMLLLINRNALTSVAAAAFVLDPTDESA